MLSLNNKNYIKIKKNIAILNIYYKKNVIYIL